MGLSFLQATSSGADASAYTFSSQNFGTASADRYLICAASARSTNSTSITSITIGGVTASLVAPVSNTASNFTSLVFGIAAVPTGTSGDVVVTWSSGQVRCGLGLWAVTGLSSATPSDTATSTANDSTQSTLDVPAGGFALGASYTGATTSATWTGLTEQYDAQVGGETGSHSGASDTFVAAQTDLTITCDWASPAANTSAGSFASWALVSAGGGPLIDGGELTKGALIRGGRLVNSIRPATEEYALRNGVYQRERLVRAA